MVGGCLAQRLLPNKLPKMDTQTQGHFQGNLLNDHSFILSPPSAPDLYIY